MLDIDTGDDYFVPTAFARQRRVVERVGPFRNAAFTSHSYAEPATYEHNVGEVPEHIGEVHEDVVNAFVPGTPTNPTLFIGYPTHVAKLIWQHQVMFLILKICTY